MNILFLTLLDFDSIKEKNLYTDLLREFCKNGHKVYCISPTERRKHRKTEVLHEENSVILKLRIGNIQKTNFIEKGISTVTLEPKLIAGIKKYFSDIKFQLVLYSTPPVTFCGAISYIKKRDTAVSYLMLKDIWPQGIIDLGVLKTSGLQGIFYRMLRKKEKKLYRVSDRIGCMSQANIDYVLQHNPEISPDIVRLCPNSMEVVDKGVDEKTRNEYRRKYGLPLDKLIFVYGGNLGRPQGIDFLLSCIRSQQENDSVYFLVVGDGTEYKKLEEFDKEYKHRNFKLMRRLPKEDYGRVMASCDVGMLFLDHRFTIPNFPSRLLDYMAAKLPVFACTDTHTDVGRVIMENGFGWWCESNDCHGFERVLNRIQLEQGLIKEMGVAGYEFLTEKWSVKKQYETVMHSLKR